MRPQRLFSIAPHGDFLGLLADRVLDGTLLGGWSREGPFWLSDVTIVLPTRRARLALAEAFLARGQRLLPDIRALGGEAGEEEEFLPPYDAPAPAPAVSPLTRRLALARLVAAWAQTPGGAEVLATPPNAGEIFTLSDQLGTLIDDLIIEGVRYETLRGLPGAELAGNWQKTLAFLDIALAYWPERLKAEGLIEPAERRNERMDRQAQSLPLLFGDRPVIAAGSTGSIPATARLLAAIASLPRGALVLPGLDTSLSVPQHEALIDAKRNPHGHPQYGLMRLLDRLGVSIAEVDELAPDQDTTRTQVVRAALAPAEETALWPEHRAALAPQIPAAMAGVTTLAARTIDEEARAIAVAAREALAAGRSVGVISPDQTLSRRIAAELRRFNIEIEDSAGTPLSLAPQGRFLRQILAAATSGFAPIDLIALLTGRAVTLGLGRQTIARLTGLVDRGLLRGRLLPPGIAGLRKTLDGLPEGAARKPFATLGPAERAEIADLLDRLEQAFAPLLTVIAEPRLTAPALVRGLAATATALTKPAPGGEASPLPGAEEFFALAEALAEGETGPDFPAIALDGVLTALLAGITVREPARSSRPIALWGLLEARLQRADLIILAGLNEDVWPRAADPGPWLSRGMRIAAGLEPPERRQGQSAHDFAMALGGEQVMIAFAERLGNAPALPSRLVQRLEAFLGDEAQVMRARGERFRMMARQLDAITGDPQPATRPVPRPPADKRPRRLSVTEVETLVRSPYDIYAKHVLGLLPLPPLGEVPDARERGAMVHDVFARFVSEGHSPVGSVAQEVLERLASEAFEGLDAIGERRDIWLYRFRRAAAMFLSFEREREQEVASRTAEVSGRWTLPVGFALTGRADRIDRRRDGTLEILDFKTGTLPSAGEMKSFLAPQLLLEAAMAMAGAFEELTPAAVTGLTYIKIGLGPDAFEPRGFSVADGLDITAAVAEAEARLMRHVDAFLLRDDLPLVAGLLPKSNQTFAGPYDHLSRLDEWAMRSGESEA